MSVSYVNPVCRDYFADPFVWKTGDTYYAVGTGPAADDKTRASVFPMMSSPDLVHWKPEGWALNGLEDGCGDAYWAPEVAYAEGVFYLYYSVGQGHKSHKLRVATSENPLGPYTDIGCPISDPAIPFAIDAHPFRSADGEWHLFYCRDFLDSDDNVRPGTAIVADRLIDMTRLAEDEHVVARASRDWQRFRANREMYGGVYDWHTLEGPSVLERDGKYYCFYSGGCFENDTYGVDYVGADNVFGTYSDDKPHSPRILRTVADRVIGPGHNSFVTGPDGKTTYIVYHAWDKPMTARRMCIDKLRWTTDGPVVDGPTWTEQRTG